MKRLIRNRRAQSVRLLYSRLGGCGGKWEIHSQAVNCLVLTNARGHNAYFAGQLVLFLPGIFNSSVKLFFFVLFSSTLICLSCCSSANRADVCSAKILRTRMTAMGLED